eukprot:11204230-Ditylum_brightwellii.AAC.1
MKSAVSEITNMTGVSAGDAESFHKDFYLGPQPGDPMEDNGNKNTSINTAIAGVTLNKTYSNNTPKVIITNLNNKDNELERNNEDQDGNAATKMTGITGNIRDSNEDQSQSNFTRFTGLTNLNSCGTESKEQGGVIEDQGQV